MTGFTVREITPADRDTWAGLYGQLFPGSTATGITREIDRIFADPSSTAYFALTGDAAIGFAEIAIRPHANGCHSKPVPFLEGIWVAPGWRGKSVARVLLARIQDLLRAQGHREMGSSTAQSNMQAQSAHKAWGFEETEAVIYWRKEL